MARLALCLCRNAAIPGATTTSLPPSLAPFGRSDLEPDYLKLLRTAVLQSHTHGWHQFRLASHSSHLAYEEITAGSPTPEHQTASPSRTLFILHGLLGCGRNWRTWARRLVEGAAAHHSDEGGPWRVLLVDLRCHGASSRRPGLHPPHNMRAAAEDVSHLIRDLMGSHAPGAVLGHSMGGKVALALLEQCKTAAEAGAAAGAGAAAPTTTTKAPGAGASHSPSWCAPPRQLWVLDSQPGLVAAEQDAGTGVSRVLGTVHSIPLPIPNRTWLLKSLRERGLSDSLATWLASNLTPWPPAGAAAAGGAHQQLHNHHNHHHQHQQQHPLQQQGRAPSTGPAGGVGAAGGGSSSAGPLTWSFDIQGAAAMYMSYRTTDFWHVLERPPHGTAVHLVQGARSDRWPADMQRRLEGLVGAPAPAASGASPGGSFRHHVLEGAGHWLHADNPEGLLRMVLPCLAGL